MIDCDFIPDDYHQARLHRRAIKLRVTLVSAMIVIMTLWIVANQHQLSGAEAMLTEIGDQREQINQHLAKRDAMEVEMNRLRDHQRLLDQFESHASLVVLLCDVSRRLPETVILTKISFRCPSLNRFGKVTSSDKSAPPAQGAVRSSVAKPEKSDEVDAMPNVAEIKMTAFANEVSEAIKCAAELERSPLVARVQMELRGESIWAGRRGQQFDLTCDLREESGVRP
jgi:hypothetical protein